MHGKIVYENYNFSGKSRSIQIFGDVQVLYSKEETAEASELVVPVDVIDWFRWMRRNDSFP